MSHASMSFSEQAEKIVSAFKADPRNKVFLGFPTLLAAATEETGRALTESDLKAAIQAYLGGGCEGDQEAVYDGATYACGYVARHCFSEDPDEDVDYEVDWIEEQDGSFTAEVRMS